MEKKPLILTLKAFDIVVIVFFILLSITNLVFHSRVEEWLALIAVNIVIILFVFFLSYMDAYHHNKFWRLLHYWYIVPLILLTFKEIYLMVKPIRVHDYDQLFIKIDRWIFGTDPTVWLSQFSHPVITEILQIVYAMFYLLPIILILFLLKKDRFLAAEYVTFAVIYGFYLSYLGYFTLPAIGPRFTLHNFATVDLELPGLFATQFLRDAINTGESIPPGTPNPADVVQRDVFPSGHTMITLIVMYLAVKLKSRSRFFILPVGVLLIFSTVYLWYHYVIDLVGGAIMAALSLWSGFHIFNWWRKKKGDEPFNYANN